MLVLRTRGWIDSPFTGFDLGVYRIKEIEGEIYPVSETGQCISSISDSINWGGAIAEYPTYLGPYFNGEDAHKALANWNDPKSSDPVFSVISSKCSSSLKKQGSRNYSNMYISRQLDGIGLVKRRANYFTNEIVAFDTYDAIPNAEFSVANRGTKKLTYTRKFWATPTTDLLNSDKSILWWHSNSVKRPGARDGIYQGKQELYFNDLPPAGDSWFVVLETKVDGAEDRVDNNKAALR